MIGKNLKGTNECFVCGKSIEWETTPSAAPGIPVVYEQPKNVAKECAVGKDDDGKAIFEIECICPKCRTKNKFVTQR